ncbi:MAG: hypothetical protein V4466_07035 [Pseudomonadota bacterium]
MPRSFYLLAHAMEDPRVVLRLKCDACRHEVAWKREQALAVFGHGATPNDVRSRIKCGRCGETGRVQAWI